MNRGIILLDKECILINMLKGVREINKVSFPAPNGMFSLNIFNNTERGVNFYEIQHSAKAVFQKKD